MVKGNCPQPDGVVIIIKAYVRHALACRNVRSQINTGGYGQLASFGRQAKACRTLSESFQSIPYGNSSIDSLPNSAPIGLLPDCSKRNESSCEIFQLGSHDRNSHAPRRHLTDPK